MPRHTILRKQSGNNARMLMFSGKAEDIAHVFGENTCRPIAKHNYEVESREFVPGEEPNEFRTVAEVAAELLDVPVDCVKPYYAEQFLGGQVGINRTVDKPLLDLYLKRW